MTHDQVCPGETFVLGGNTCPCILVGVVGNKAAPHMCSAEVALLVVKSSDGFDDRILRELRDSDYLQSC